ncbi:unnamed protein product [Albugo candida]|uniref:Uncharacterized protein n=1 Tax=Albugo candida TaxID=65357 RepID=A0A024FV33_9STRA|nr:unnamed protein product [Albugo candida]|eukprot:CCI10911.1 unnamed protein product [Albugo candida]
MGSTMLIYFIMLMWFVEGELTSTEAFHWMKECMEYSSKFGYLINGSVALWYTPFIKSYALIRGDGSDFWRHF